MCVLKLGIKIKIFKSKIILGEHTLSLVDICFVNVENMKTTTILSIGQNAFRFAKLFGYFPFSFESEKVESDTKFVKLKLLHVFFHVIILCIQILWIVKYFTSMSPYTVEVAEDQRIVTDEIGYVVCGVLINVIMVFIRFQKLWRKQFVAFWKNLITYQEELSTLMAEDENLSTKFSEFTKSIRKQLNFR